MNAKAKVVAWYWTDSKGKPVCVYGGERPYDDAIALIPLTDHEAALAELVADRDTWETASGAWQEIAERYKARNTTLPTSLDALAGAGQELLDSIVAEEISKNAIECVDDYPDDSTIGVFRDLLRTLASSATGEKNTEEGGRDGP